MSDPLARSGFSRPALSPVSVLGALCIYGLAQKIGLVIQEAYNVAAGESAALDELFAKAQTLKERFAREERFMRAELPLRIDE